MQKRPTPPRCFSEAEQKARRVGQQKTRAMAGFKGWFQP
jgi:hypothetical protein